MSTKSTFILTNKNEHIYHDCSDNTIMLEFDKNNIVIREAENDITIQVNPGSNLYEKLSEIFWKSGWCGTDPVNKNND